MTGAGEEDRFSRWSRLKREARAEAGTEAEARAEAPRDLAAAETDAGEPEPDFEAMPDEEALAALGLPAPEAMKEGDDFSAFMSARVPLRLRNRALRTLWRSNPVLACVDGLNDYDGDFTDAATVVEGMKTAYRVGEGFARRALADDHGDGHDDGAPAPAAPAAPDDGAATGEDGAGRDGEEAARPAAAPASAAPVPDAGAGDQIAAAPDGSATLRPDAAPAEAAPSDPRPAPRRRMVFRT